ncbi:hypothetical protein FH972_006842 [Carpinus fangiana]|uniref:Legume lectin domain-containing protein n=1 Tax=Carpinus fangiana TaxID=176857 RepID=A0A5N6QTT6_9ROSI|nr:hypothetical protein FH972_006842 [Carpinus fangiana]
MATILYSIFKLPLFLILLFLLPSANSVSFKISRFEPNASNIQYHGEAAPSYGAIEMNKASSTFGVGWATYAERVPLWDSNTGNVSDFTTHFTFIIDTLGRNTYSDGLAFFLAPAGFEIPPNSRAEYLGLFNSTTTYSSQNQIVLVEFDSCANHEWDPPVEHVGINSNSIASAVYTPWNASFHSGDIADVWITYNASTKNLSVSWSYQRTSSSQEDTSLSYPIDLSKVLPEYVTIGFSAAFGPVAEKHTLLSWGFNSSLDIKGTSGKKEKNTRLIMGFAASSSVLIVGSIIAFAIFWGHKQKRRVTAQKRGETRETMNLASINGDLERGAGPRRGDLLLAMDEKLQNDFDEKKVECLMIVGLWCAHPDRNLRPSIRQAISVLNFDATTPNLPTQMPVPIYPIHIASVSSSGHSITTSLHEGR